MVTLPSVPMDTGGFEVIPSPSNPPPSFRSTLLAEGPVETGAIFVKLSFKTDPSDNHPVDANTNRGRFADKITSLARLLALKLNKIPLFFRGNDNQQLDANGLAGLSESSLKSVFNHSFVPYMNNRNTTRPHLFRFTIITTASFSDIKRCCRDWLIQNDMYMRFQSLDVARTIGVGYLLNLEPRHIMRSDLNQNLNNTIKYHLSQMSPAEKTQFYTASGCKDTAPDRTAPTIRLLIKSDLAHPQDTTNPVTTRTLLVECDFDDRAAVEQLLMTVTKADPYFGCFMNRSMAIRNDQLSNFRALVIRHNKLLTEHKVIPIAGISPIQMDAVQPSSDFTTLRDMILEIPGITRIERHPAAKDIGKWLLFTSADNFETTIKHIDTALPTLFPRLQLTSQYPRFRSPTRLTTAAPPADYVSFIVSAAVDATDDDSTPTLAPPNAWRSGSPAITPEVTPPKLPDTQTQASDLSDLRTISTKLSQLEDFVKDQQKLFENRLQQQLAQTKQDQDSFLQSVRDTISRSMQPVPTPQTPDIASLIHQVNAANQATMQRLFSQEIVGLEQRILDQVTNRINHPTFTNAPNQTPPFHTPTHAKTPGSSQTRPHPTPNHTPTTQQNPSQRARTSYSQPPIPPPPQLPAAANLNSRFSSVADDDPIKAAKQL